LADSKTLSEAQRSALAIRIREHSLAWAVAGASVEEIDTLNILQATLLAMQRAVAGLPIRPEIVLVDGNRLPILACPVRTIVRGDATEPAISAASILAKVTRDEDMRRLDQQYPHYGLAKHKGYPTPEHLSALARLGPSPVHRRSFRPVRESLTEKDT
jgi:ribonuclease HII